MLSPFPAEIHSIRFWQVQTHYLTGCRQDCHSSAQLITSKPAVTTAFAKILQSPDLRLLAIVMQVFSRRSVFKIRFWKKRVRVRASPSAPNQFLLIALVSN
jgi:hypothetical protein